MNHLRLTVRDIDEAVEFYDGLLAFLGYELIQRDDRRAAWAMPGPGGHLQWFILSVATEQLSGERHTLEAPGFHHFAFNVDSRADVDGFHELLVDRGAEVLDAPAEYDYEPTYYAVFFRDPNGFKLEVVNVDARNPLDAVRTMASTPQTV